MAAYYNGGRTMPYSNTDECFDDGRTMSYSNTNDDCYDAGKHGHGHGHGNGRTNMYSNTTDEECFDGGRHGHGHGGGRTMSYSNTTEEECYGSGEQGQGYYKREEKQHKNRERVGEAGALATGAFAMYEGYEAKKDPAHARKHQIEAGVAGTAALGAGGYAYHEHREQKQAGYGGQQEYRTPVHNSYCN
uniref:Late embryogenesis abundant protein 17 n=1 Tax=Leymus chinensis TaxID=52714 RepID=A0A7U3VFM3_LEYCH|nr:late embryogenesis abundant protein 17 [Leymus chinensis]